MTSPAESSPATLPELIARAVASGGARGVDMLDGRGRRAERRSWAEVYASARAAAGRLRALGVEPGEPVMLALGTGFPFLELWLGAVLAGALPVAAAPPGGLGSPELVLRRLASVLERLGARRVIAASALGVDAQKQGLAAFADALIAPEALAALEPKAFDPAPAAPDDVAFLQLTSGSTGVPRAVRISHRGAVENPRAMLAAVSAADPALGRGMRDGSATCVSWLPLHHDMGLVGCLLTSLAAGAELMLAPPRTFLGRPETWLQGLSRRLAVSTAPNFAYQTCVERVDASAAAGLELSGWRAALCGAEMVQPRTLAAFAERFAPLGFDARAFRPCYGLAEATLAVSFDVRGEGVRSAQPPRVASQMGQASSELAREVACVGAPVQDTKIAIVGRGGTQLPDGEVGEVRVHGPGVFLGYHGDPAATAEALVDGWLVTGDLGFLKDGELYLTGRTKDILIVRGQNLMPHELEWIAEAAAGGGGVARAAAFSVAASGAAAGEGEKAVLAVETAESDPAALAALEREIRVRIGRALGIPLADCVFVRRGRLPRTTSGKVQRREVARRYQAGELERLVVEAAP